jgi:outer membrane receptor protein involved in Fe transport
VRSQFCGASNLKLRAAIRQQLIAASIASCIAAPQAAHSSDSSTEGQVSGELAEITVTATRRSESVIDVPFNVSAYDGNSFTDLGVTDLPSLAHVVPGLSIPDRGPAFAAATVPIIRGLNATSVNGYIPQGEQTPVTTYIGDVPVFGYLPLEDVSRVEVLRGPQGTLYGSGSLGGAIRIIPNRPQLDGFTVDFTGEGSSYDHAEHLGYRAVGIVNAPINDAFAFRADASYQEIPGYIDQHGVLARGPGSNATAVPILANPSDVATSPGVFYTYNGVNYSGIASVRGDLLWQPAQAFHADLSYEHARAFGNGFSADNSGYPGGVDSIDPRIIQPRLGDYQSISRGLNPWSRQVDLTALELSYDTGFATVTSATAYYASKGLVDFDVTPEVVNYGPILTPYYAGQPYNPRLLCPGLVSDSDHTVTQELRLVSNAGKTIDWSVGAFYLHQDREGDLNFYLPGTNAETLASGSPDIVTTSPDGESFYEYSSQRFEDKSVFGEVTWHITARAQVTAGARQFWDDFHAAQETGSYVFVYNVTTLESNAAADHIFKLNTSFDITDNSRVYATWSQGFRRGGTNVFPLQGIVAEPSSLLLYVPDKTDNYEFGFKGKVGGRLLYTVDVFDVEWTHAQFDTRTPVNGWPVVENSNGARSRGAEFEATIKALDDRLTATISGEYSDARFSKDFILKTEYGFIGGQSGDRLPGSPKTSAALVVSYDQPLSPDRTITYSVNGSFTGDVVSDVKTSESYAVLPAYSLWNASVMFGRHEGWKVGAFANNLFNKRVEYGNVNYPLAPEFDLRYVGQPRQIGLRIQYAH